MGRNYLNRLLIKLQIEIQSHPYKVAYANQRTTRKTAVAIYNKYYLKDTSSGTHNLGKSWQKCFICSETMIFYLVVALPQKFRRLYFEKSYQLLLHITSPNSGWIVWMTETKFWASISTCPSISTKKLLSHLVLS